MSSTQPLSPSAPQKPTSRPASLKSVGRSHSLRLPSKPVDIPVPPSLAQSPHWTSPHSIFRRALSHPPAPSREDEEWLRDTVPLSWEDREATLGPAKPEIVVVVRRQEGEDVKSRGRSSERGNEGRKLSETMSSPPLVRMRLPRADVPTRTSNWIQRTTAAAHPRLNNTISLRFN